MFSITANQLPAFYFYIFNFLSDIMIVLPSNGYCNLFHFLSDTVFNQSRYTWSWGSPDILPMFSKGASLGQDNSTRVFTEMYDPSFEDFSSKDLSQLDTWVFDKVETFFEKAASDPELQMKLRQDKLVLVSSFSFSYAS